MTTSQRPVHRWARVALTLFIAPLCGAAEKPNAKVDKLFEQWNREDSPGAAIVIVKDGSVVYQRGYGSANLETRTPVTPQTVFDVASVAKQFAGLAVAMLVEQGKLSLDDDVRKHLPDVPDFGKPITIAHLIHHTSGLRDWPETLALSGMDWSGVITLETILEMVQRQRELDFAPGEDYQYSNTGYNLLAAIVAKLEGQSFRKWSDANIFKPLGMKHTHVCENPTDVVPNRADSYISKGNNKFTRVVSQLAGEGSSSLFITAEDMGKWLLNFKTAKVGGKALERMRQPGKLNNGKEVDYGFGIALGKYHEAKRISHTGSWAGYRSIVLVIPEQDFGVAILANVGNVNTSNLGTKIADLYLGNSAAPEKTNSTKPSDSEKLEPSTFVDYLGTYRLGVGWHLEITRNGDQLMTQATREDKFNMTPTSNGTFFVKSYGSEIEFVRENSGPVTHLLYRGIRAPRLDLPKFTPAQLQGYVGDYWSEEVRVMYRIEMRESALSVQRSGAWVRLLPTGADSFDADRGGATLEFTRNGASEISELKVSGGRIRNVRFIRSTLPRSTSASLK